MIHETEEQLWRYNCEDTVRTQECLNVVTGVLAKMGLEKVNEFQQAMFWPVLKAMQLGVRIDQKVRSQMALELLEETTKREEWFTSVLGHPLNPRSPKQMHTLFYDDLRMPVIRKMGRPTLDEDALQKLGNKQPILKPLIKRITEHRSLGVFLGTFVKAPLDIDSRMRCSYNICGASTYRLSSSKNAFGSGANLQTIPEGTKAVEPEDLELPNIRKMFIPDPGYEFFNLDLDRADLQVVVWESGDENLKKALRMGVDMHCMNAVDVYRIKGIPVEELAATHPNYPERRAQIGETKRQRAKVAVHAVDYACKARTLAEALGCTVHEADEFITNWFAAHPGIKRWHERVDTELRTRRMIRNKYGYLRFFFERVEGLLPEALAWVPQSTVAITINKIWYNIHHSLPDVQVLLQVHDSLAGQLPLGFDTSRIKEQSRVVIPYEDPLIIPVSIKSSHVSWGDCH